MQTVHCGTLVNAAGPSAGYLAKKLGIHLPVEPRKRNVFVLDCPAFSGHHDLPLLVDPTGAYIRPETSGYYLSGIAPAKVRASVVQVETQQWLVVAEARFFLISIQSI